MPLLYVAQEEYGWLSEEALIEVADLCDVDPTQAHSIAGFYTMFRETPKGQYWFQVCTDLPCALRGADEFYKALCDYPDVEDGGTTEDGIFSLTEVECLGSCGTSPMMQINDTYYENLTMAKAEKILDDLREKAKNG